MSIRSGNKMSKHNITVTGVTGGRVERSNVAGIVHGGMGNTLTTTHNQENRQQTYNIENAQGVVGGQDMRGASVNQGGLTGGRSGHSAHFEGKGSRNITNQGNTGNMATGDNHSGAMSASVDGPTSGTKGPQTLTPEDLLKLVKGYHCTDDTTEKFVKQGVPGRLFMQLDEALLDDLGIDSRIERRKLYALHEDLCK